jgi:hypothetical protein
MITAMIIKVLQTIVSETDKNIFQSFLFFLIEYSYSKSNKLQQQQQ